MMHEMTVRASDIESNFHIDRGSAISPMQPAYERNWLCPPTSKCDDDYNRSVSVTDKTIMTYPPMYRGIVLLANMVAKLPLNLVCGNEETGIDCEIQKDHPAHWLMRHQPNSVINAYDFKRTMQYHKCLGNAYAHIGRTVSGGLFDLTPLDPNPQRTFPLWASVNGQDDLVYCSHVGDKPMFFHHKEILHFKELSYDGILGHRLSDLFKKELGLGMVTTEHKLEFYCDGGVGGGILYFKGGLNPDRQNEILRYWKSIKSNRRGGTRVAKLNKDHVEFVENEIQSKAAETDATRKFQISMSANMIGIPQHKLGGEQLTSYGSLEQENKALLSDGYDPHLCAIEAQCDQKLLTKDERLRGFHFQFDRKKIEQASVEEMTNAADKYVNGGQGTLDEWNRRHGLPADKTGCGDRLRMPANIQFCDQKEESAAASVDPREEAVMNIARKQVESILDRLRKSATSAAKRKDRYEAYRSEFGEKHVAPVANKLESTNNLLKSFGLSQISGLAEGFLNELPDWSRAEDVAAIAKSIASEWPDKIIGEIRKDEHD